MKQKTINLNQNFGILQKFIAQCDSEVTFCILRMIVCLFFFSKTQKSSETTKWNSRGKKDSFSQRKRQCFLSFVIFRNESISLSLSLSLDILKIDFQDDL